MRPGSLAGLTPTTINVIRMVIWLIRLLQNLPAVAEDCLNPKVSLTGLGVRQAGNEGRFRGVPFFWRRTAAMKKGDSLRAALLDRWGVTWSAPDRA